ncbi:transcriptional regulator with XRE-family HTH domain [Lipingzhangella halophila]|uniref:Transcriptional regulator with XRE-family HTH domain n=1 Tax=Lipingzhangella halophila TaxID=1783352 RepID=A0A7W7RLZ2_9ACTN|nr:helix-turn-helix domain-containing protein [Lipingzhangella halophila]MBB4934435.1 transcriptional regulator with XRE-family HTH domain [Lipingzhangella halophila]
MGKRVRAARRAKGMNIATLAGLIGRSKGWMSMVENGQTPLDKRQDIAAIAEVLEVSADTILGEPADDINARLPSVNLVRLREVLHEYSLDDPPDVPVRPLDQTAADLRTLDDQLRRTDYDAMMRTLPGVLDELHAGAHLPEPARSEALRQLITACGLAVIVMRHFGHSDLAWISGDRSRQAAVWLGDPVWDAAAAYQRAHARSSANRSRALLATPRIVDELEPHIGDDPMAHQVHGMLRLSAALAQQVSGDHDEARRQAEEAARLAARFEIPDDPNAWELFGVSNVGVWRTTLAVEAGDPAAAMRISDQVNTAALASKNRKAALHMDRFRALHMLGRDKLAGRELQKAERLSVAQVRHSPLIQETVRDMTAIKDPVLRGVAWRMGVI